MRKTLFTIGEYPEAYIGYTSGRLWNGWATPHFEKDEALRVMRGYNECREEAEQMTYDEENDMFIAWLENYNDYDYWKGEDIQTTDGIKHLYGIGAYSWVWDKEEIAPTARAIDELFGDYDIVASYTEITEALRNVENLKKAFEILKSDDAEELQIKRLREVLQ